MDIKILGSGCANCQRLETNTRQALDDIGVEATIEHVTDPADIASWGVMHTPALVDDDEVVISGRVASAAEVTALLTK